MSGDGPKEAARHVTKVMIMIVVRQDKDNAITLKWNSCSSPDAGNSILHKLEWNSTDTEWRYGEQRGRKIIN